MNSDQANQVLKEFDPLSDSAPPDHAHSSQPAAGETSGKQPDVGSQPSVCGTSTEISASSCQPAVVPTMITPGETAPPQPKPQDATPTISKAPPIITGTGSLHITDTTPTSCSVDGTTPPRPYSSESASGRISDISSSSSHKKKKKKKKHKKHSSNQSPSRGHVTKTTPLMSSEQIGTEISQIDQFLQSLKMGTYDPMGTQTTTKPTTTTTTTITTTKQTVTTTEPAISTTTATQTTTTTTVRAAAMGVPLPSVSLLGKGQPSLGMQLIGQFDSSSSSSSDSESSSGSSDEEECVPLVVIEEGPGEDSDGGEKGHKEEGKKAGRYNYPMIKNEIQYRDMPPLESCDIPFPEAARLLPLGKVSHITEELVVIQSLPETTPVDEGTVLWSEDKKSLSVIFEIFGPVKSPYYSVHVHSPDHAQSLGLDPGKVVYVIPGDAELTKYVFTQQLLQQRGSDASWKDDTEIPGALQDYSDDEAEMESKKTGKRQNKTTPTTSGPDSAHNQHRQPKKQAPRYSGDQKMEAYFPRARQPPPAAARPPANYYPGPHPPQFQGGRGVPYFTPRGFMGFMPPWTYPPVAMYPYPPPLLTTPRPSPHYMMPNPQAPPTFSHPGQPQPQPRPLMQPPFQN